MIGQRALSPLPEGIECPICRHFIFKNWKDMQRYNYRHGSACPFKFLSVDSMLPLFNRFTWEKTLRCLTELIIPRIDEITTEYFDLDNEIQPKNTLPDTQKMVIENNLKLLPLAYVFLEMEKEKKDSNYDSIFDAKMGRLYEADTTKNIFDRKEIYDRINTNAKYHSNDIYNGIKMYNLINHELDNRDFFFPMQQDKIELYRISTLQWILNTSSFKTLYP